MNDRGMIKWAPFDSLIPSKEVIQKISLEKSKLVKPILDSEQIEEIETILWTSFHNQITIFISYFKNGMMKEKTGRIMEIHPVSKKIFFMDQTFLYFDQILKVQLCF